MLCSMPLNILLVEKRASAELLARALRAREAEVTITSTEQEAVDALVVAVDYDLVLVSTRLDDGPGLEIARLATLMLPTPRVMVLDAAALTTDEAFALGSAGVQALLHKPISADAILEVLRGLDRDTLPPVYALLARYVGRVSLLAFEREVRNAMALQALEKAGGSRSEAARLLRTSRQTVQKAVNDDELVRDRS